MPCFPQSPAQYQILGRIACTLRCHQTWLENRSCRQMIENILKTSIHIQCIYIYTHTNYIYSGFPISMFDYQMVHASCELNYVHTILPAKCCDPKTITVLALPLQLPVDPFAYDVYSPQQRSCGLVVDEIDNLVCTLFMLGTSVAKRNTPQGHL